MADEYVVDHDRAVAAADAVVVVGEGVVEHVYGFEDIPGLEVLAVVPVDYHADSGIDVVVNVVAGDPNHTVRIASIIDDLNPVFPVSVDLISRDRDVQSRPYVALQADFDAIVAVVAEDVVREDDFHVPVDIETVIAVELERAVLDQAAAAVFVVHSVGGIMDPAVEQVEWSARCNAVIGVLDGKALDDRPLLGAARDFNHEGTGTAIEDGGADVARVTGREKPRCQGDRLGDGDLPGVGPRLHDDRVTGARGIVRRLNRRVVSRNGNE